jgi:hypothetical protein
MTTMFILEHARQLLGWDDDLSCGLVVCLCMSCWPHDLSISLMSDHKRTLYQ